MHTDKYGFFLLSIISIIFSSFTSATDCRSTPPGLCVVYLNSDDSYINVWFDSEITVNTLVIGYDLSSWRSWFLINNQTTSFSSFQISNLADYDSSQNESVWFTAYRALGAQCWNKTELLYFYDRWDGDDRIVSLDDYASQWTNEISVEGMIIRVQEKYSFTDTNGYPINFCHGELSVVQE